jgi:hypothetical protein
MNLATLQEAQQFVGFDIQDGTLEADMIGHVSRRIESYCGTPDFLSAERTEYHDGGSRFLRLKHWPVTAVAAIYEDSDHVWDADSLLDTEDYYVSANEHGVVSSEVGQFACGYESIKVVYTAGYPEAAVPQPLKTALLIQLKYEIQRLKTGRTDDDADLLPEVRHMLRDYRRILPIA